MTHRATTLLAACAIVALGVAAWSDSFSGPFVFDDQAIKDNPGIRSLWPLGPVLAGPRPVVNLTLAINYAIGGLDVTGYHVVNLAVHLLAALVLFGIVRRTLLLPKLRDRFGRASTGLATAVALIWALHPLQTESVTYIAQRAESLMGLFYLLTLYAFIRAAAAADDFDSSHDSDSHAFAWSAAAIAACALGMGAKPVMVTAPLVVLAYDRLFVSPSIKDALRRSWRLYLGLAATWLLLAYLVARTPAEPSAGFGMASLTSGQYARSQFGVIVHYLALTFRPWPLCLDYGWPVASDPWAILPPALIVLALIGATVAALRRASPLAFPGVWFFLILAPTSSIMPIHDLCVEHRMYLPLAAVVALGVVGAYALGRRALEFAVPAESRRLLGIQLAAISCLLVVGFLGSLTFLRNQLYQDEATLWKDATLHRPQNPRAFLNLGCALLNQNRCEEAVPCFLDALRISPDYADAHSDLGRALSELGRYDEAMGQLTEALRLHPGDPVAQCYLGNTLVALGKTPEAVPHYRKAVELDPEFTEAHYDLANALADQGRPAEAIPEYERTLKLAPGNAAAHNNLGRLLARQGRPAEALAHYQEALRLLPDAPVVLMNLAWLRATCPDPNCRDAAEALRLARRACAQPVAPSARALDVLAAACAEAGRFEEAVAAARQALEAAEHGAEKTSAAEIQARLKLYESRKPYREPAAGGAAPTAP